MSIIFSTNPNFKFSEPETVETLSPEKQDLRVFRETKHRGGKTAIVIKNFVGDDDDLQKLAKELKTKCGVGGSAKDGEIIIQGDVRDKVCEILTRLNYRFKKAGG
ncbi:MAG: translation initiation factor [Bacteroidales bacterium]|nr:translation initiation factor [Bacteroidales bacterium]